jgi:capsular polysaccharide biosynthesis protein/Mrp family chromosome partitioning ATPase
MVELERKRHQPVENLLMLSNILRAVRRWWWLIALAMIIAAGSAYRSAAHTPRFYQASTTVMVGRVIQQVNPDANTFTLLDRLTSFYANVVTRAPILDGAAKSLSPPTTAGEIAGRVQARAIAGTQFIEITYLDANPQRAAQVANAIATELIKQSPTPDAALNQQQLKFAQDQLTDLQTKITQGQDRIRTLEGTIATSASAAEIADARDNEKELQAQIDGWQATYTTLLTETEPSQTNYLSIIEPAAIPSIPIASSKLLVIGVGSILGLALAFGGILVIEYLDDTLRRPSDVPAQTGIPLLSTVPRQRRRHVRAAAPFNALRNTLLEQTSVTPLRLLIASPRARTGVSYTAVGLAEAFARSGHRVVLVDGNLISPMVHTLFETPKHPGLVEVISNPAILPDALHQTHGDCPGLTVVPAGGMAGSDDIMASPGVPVALDAIVRQVGADVLIVDGGAFGDPTRASRLLACYLPQTVLVVNGRTRARTVSTLVDALTASGTQVTGLVYNACRPGVPGSHDPRTGRLVRSPRAILGYFGFGVQHAPEQSGAGNRTAGVLAIAPTGERTLPAPGESANLVTED